MAAWIFADGRFFKVPEGQKLQTMSGGGAVILNRESEVIAVVNASPTSFVVLGEESPEVATAKVPAASTMVA